MRLPVTCLLAVCAALPPSVNAATVSTAGASVKILRNQAPTASRAVAISAARNEFEAFQILVTGPATGVTASATALSNGTTAIGPVRLFREELIRMVHLSAPDAIVAAGGWVPDALVPDVDDVVGEKRNAFVNFHVAAGETRAIWAEVRVPASAAAGTYTGSVTVRFAEGTATVPVTLTVHDFALPAKASLKSAFTLAYGTLPAGHGISTAATVFPPLRARYGQLALDHRVSLAPHRDGDTSIAHFEAAYGPLVGGTAATQQPGAALTSVEFVAGHTNTAGMKSWYDHFVAKGWGGDKLLQYTCDEPPATCAWTDIPTRLRAAKAANPAFRTLVTSSLGQIQAAEAKHGIAILRDLDLIVPVINHLWDRPGEVYAGPQYQKYASFVASGPRKELWAYQSCMSHGCGGASSHFTGWPSYMIDASAVRNRAMQWLEFLYGVTGELYYETTMAYTHDAWSNQWDFTGNGDGTLFYPGTPARIGGATHIPVASIRLKMIREGMEDFEYLKLLSDLGDRAMAQREASTLFPSAYQTAQSPEALMAARARIAQRILALRNGAAALSTGARYTPGVLFTGDPAELPVAPLALSGAAAGSDNTADVRLSYDDDFLYASFAVKDAAVVVNQGGRDGEVWDGDAVELLLDVKNDKAVALGANHFHLLVNANGDLTDERGNAGAWDRSWTSGATSTAARTASGWAVELRVPWAALGVAPCAGATLGLDFAIEDVDQAGASPKPFDWAQLSRFAQPSRWGTLVLTALVAGDRVPVQRATSAVVVDGDLSEFTRAPAVSLDAAAAKAGSDNKVAARLLHDATHLYVGFTVGDAALRIGQGGRDGEVWDGDGVELLLDPRLTRSATPDADDRHLVVNASGDLTDEKGNAGTWDRSWTSGAALAVAGAPGRYTVELAVPWTALGVPAPAAGAELGIDLAANDLDLDAALRQFDWAGLARFAQPALWKRARFEPRPPACTGF
ncbi:MAG TPA: glycoside hydrolase domain-containing protein [Anaeromyxobacter sp.]|nr:glycoside hydrolase domain-containing protein [Anaeromyxobacter sp.]